MNVILLKIKHGKFLRKMDAIKKFNKTHYEKVLKPKLDLSVPNC